MQQFFETIDFSFKYMMIGFNFLTLAMVFFLKRNKKAKKQHHILFVIAHPDDEVMFFGPTLTSLVSDYFVHILCLSGGEIRQQQLKMSASNFGIHKFKCLNHDKLVDGLKQKWCQQTIKQEVICYAKQNNIKAFFTFDDQGVSSHPNHKAIYYALSSLQKTSQISKEQKKESTKGQEQSQKDGEIYKIYYLQSVNIIRKYSGCIQIILALLKQFSWLQINVYNAWFSQRFTKVNSYGTENFGSFLVDIRISIPIG